MRALSMAVTSNPFTRPLLDGTVGVAGVELVPLGLHPSELFWRQLRFNEFDIFEMSMASCLRLESLGDRRFVSLPVFTTRTLCHLGIVVRDGVGIETAADLKGRKVGVPEYQQTSAVWSRGVLKHHFGVDPTEVHWMMERSGAQSHGQVTAFAPPADVRLDVIAEDESIGSLLGDGRLDASLLYLSERNLVDRSPDRSNDELRVRRLFDATSERRRYFGGGGVLHATHCVAIRRELAEELPWLALNVFHAFDEAKRGVIASVAESLAPWTHLVPEADQTARQLSAVDPAPYGVAANVLMLEQLAAYTAEQGIAERVIAPDELFAPQTLDL